MHTAFSPQVSGKRFRVLAVLVFIAFVACNSGDNNNNDNTPNGNDDINCGFADDFSGSLNANWTIGTNTINNPSGPAVAIKDGRVAFKQAYDYIETTSSFSNNFSIEFDVVRETGSHQCADYYIELVAADGTSGIMRFRYGSDAKESINIGKGPAPEEAHTWDCIHDPSFLVEMDHTGESKGTLTLICKNNQVLVAFTNDEGQSIFTQWVTVMTFSSTKIRIWGIGGQDSECYVDNVKICDESNTNSDTDSRDNINNLIAFKSYKK